MKIECVNLENLATKEFDSIPDEPGIYFVRWIKNGEPVPIPRLGGVDRKGILYVGSATKLKRRVRRLWRGISRKKIRAHTIGKTILFCKVFEIVNLNEYGITWEALKTVDDARGQEWGAIKSYADKYKEPPPLNLGIRREFFAIIGIAKIGKFRIGYNLDEFVRSIIS